VFLDSKFEDDDGLPRPQTRVDAKPRPHIWGVPKHIAGSDITALMVRTPNESEDEELFFCETPRGGRSDGCCIASFPKIIQKNPEITRVRDGLSETPLKEQNRNQYPNSFSMEGVSQERKPNGFGAAGVVLGLGRGDCSERVSRPKPMEDFFFFSTRNT
jgi:hypothetical protein